MLIMSPYFYAGSIQGRKMCDNFFEKNEHMKKYKYLLGYLCFMAGITVVFAVLFIALNRGND